MRQIVIDTETTGLEPEKGHRIIEIGCVELIDRKITGNTFHRYINPQREIEEEALAIHGITSDFLQDKPIFDDISTVFLSFINGAELIAHNANFDVDFINHEILLASKDAKLLGAYVTVFDTLALARKKFPGQRNTLDAICKRYKIDLSARKLHGALLDAQLLAEVYLLMTGGQSSLFTSDEFTTSTSSHLLKTDTTSTLNLNRGITPIIYTKDFELTDHNELLKKIKKKSGKCLWK